MHPETASRSAELKAEALFFFALHHDNRLLATQSKARAMAKAQNILGNFGRLKPEYQQLLDDLDADMRTIVASENQ